MGRPMQTRRMWTLNSWALSSSVWRMRWCTILESRLFYWNVVRIGKPLHHEMLVQQALLKGLYPMIVPKKKLHLKRILCRLCMKTRQFYCTWIPLKKVVSYAWVLNWQRRIKVLLFLIRSTIVWPLRNYYVLCMWNTWDDSRLPIE